MPTDTWYMEIHYELTSLAFAPAGPLFLNVADTTNFNPGGIGWTGIVGAEVYDGTFYAPPGPSAQPFGVPVVATQDHTPAAETSVIDGTPMNFSPASGGGYVAQWAGRQGRFFQVGVFQPAAVPPFTEGWLDSWKIGSVPGGDDILRWNAATDGFGPLTVIAGTAVLAGGRVHFPPVTGGLLQFDFLNPWPVPFTFHCSFSVGVTRNLLSFSNLPPPDDIELVQAALPETLLSQGYRIEFGTFNPDGTPRPFDNVRDATVALLGLQEPEDEQ